jgi:hypothetical protein
MSAQADAAAAWWADALRAPRQDNGDPLQSMLMTVLASQRDRPSDTDLDAFATALAATIDARIAGGRTWICIGVDYGPDRELSDAMTAAGVSHPIAWPCKTRMYITPGKDVTVAAGYGADEVPIWVAPETP